VIRVAYDAGPAKLEPTGVGVYVRDLGAALKLAYGDQIRIFGSRRDGPLAGAADRFMQLERYQLWLQRWGSQEARATGADLAHYTNAVAPLYSALPFVVTVQDLSVLRYPRYHPFRRVLTAPVLTLAVHRAQRVIVPSKATAGELIRLLRVPAAKLAVTELAPAIPADPVGPRRSAEILEELGLTGTPYVLSISTLEPRKNIHRLVAAFERVADQDLRLVLLGGRGWHTAVIDRAIARSRAKERIFVPGYVTDEVRHVLLERSRSFAYVSIYEGYGLPIVEAMAAGVPVVASNVSSMPEAAGGAAVLVDPFDVPAIARGIEESLVRREELIAAGRERAGRISWERTAAETMAVYESVALPSV
jgi:glycosyltransferase involved in cell wall biosynthesis